MISGYSLMCTLLVQSTKSESLTTCLISTNNCIVYVCVYIYIYAFVTVATLWGDIILFSYIS